MKQEKLMWALNDVGDDLLHMAEHRRFSNPWRKWIATAACVVLVVSLTTLVLPYLPMGCGSGLAPESTETAVEQEYPEMEESAAEETEPMATPEAETEESVNEQMTPETADRGEEEPSDGTDMVVWGGTWYYLIEDVWQKPGNLGEKLGVVEDSNRQELLNCPVYAVRDATWYSNHAVNGVAVPDQIYVETADGYVYGMTYNEKIVSRYTAEDVQAALDKGDTQWIIDTFVQPMEKWKVREVIEGATDRENWYRLFLASLEMNTGVVLSDWMDRLVPSEDFHWRLSRFFDNPPSGIGGQAFAESIQPQEVTVTFSRGVVEGNTLFLWVNLPDTEKFYEIRFDTDSWRYVNIELPYMEPDESTEAEP